MRTTLKSADVDSPTRRVAHDLGEPRGKKIAVKFDDKVVLEAEDASIKDARQGRPLDEGGRVVLVRRPRDRPGEEVAAA